MKISIIIPVYNAARFILAALDSIVSQTHADWECILIDDCSTDDSALLIDDYIKRHPDRNIRYFQNKVNLRQGPSRNLGVTLSAGSHIMFMDNDDLLPPNALQLMMESIADNDLLVGNFARFQDGSNPPEIIFTGAINPDLFYTPREEAFSNLYNMVYPWAKLYKKSFWLKHGFEFPKEKFEDTIVWPAISYLAKKIVVISNVIYLHRVGNIYSDGSRIPPNFQLYFDSLQVRLNVLKRYGLLDSQNYYWGFCLADAYQHIEDMAFSIQRYRMFKLLQSFLPQLPAINYLNEQIIPAYKVKKLKKMYKYGILYFLKPKTHFLKRLLKRN